MNDSIVLLGARGIENNRPNVTINGIENEPVNSVHLEGLEQGFENVYNRQYAEAQSVEEKVDVIAAYLGL